MCFTVACPKRQTTVLNGKSIFLCCFPTNVDEIRSDDGPWEDLGTRQILSSLVGKQPRKVDLPFRTDVCRLGQATVPMERGYLYLSFDTFWSKICLLVLPHWTLLLHWAQPKMENCRVRSPYPLEVPGFLDVQVFEISLKKHNFDKNKRLRLQCFGLCLRQYFVMIYFGGPGGWSWWRWGQIHLWRGALRWRPAQLRRGMHNRGRQFKKVLPY